MTGQHVRPGTLDRMLMRAEKIDSEDRYETSAREEEADLDRAHLITSKLIDSRNSDRTHAPVLDIDFPAQLIPSTTPGHFHLYLDKPMSEHSHNLLLETLAKVGVIEQGFADASIARGHADVRLPWIRKGSLAIEAEPSAPDALINAWSTGGDPE